MAFSRSQRKSIRRIPWELQVPRATVHKVLRKRLCLSAYKVHILQELKPENNPRRMLDRIGRDYAFLTNIMFTDEATFHVSGAVNDTTFGYEDHSNPTVMEHERDGPKVNVWCGVTCTMIIGQFFFAEKTVTGSSYLDAFPQL
ncbi:hypothetical protein B7P43_G02718 [Cryptotermes secundus]|uniref:Tc1-like transposase DDE domain-containing protein n=1 Tax=Cryptotermes secundus TaxID=105785 RepID=A0A2J7RQF9_9NEOP|nr:hypothetical protein B7P43_G02718 [Cryptotermes secundus]